MIPFLVRHMEPVCGTTHCNSLFQETRWFWDMSFDCDNFFMADTCDSGESTGLIKMNNGSVLFRRPSHFRQPVYTITRTCCEKNYNIVII